MIIAMYLEYLNIYVISTNVDTYSFARRIYRGDVGVAINYTYDFFEGIDTHFDRDFMFEIKKYENM